MKFTVPPFCSDYRSLPESRRERIRRDWLDTPVAGRTGRRTQFSREAALLGAFAQDQGSRWVLRLVEAWGLDDPILKNPAFLAIGSYQMLWRLLRKGDATTDLLARLAGMLGTPRLPPNGKSEAGIHVAAVLSLADWFERTDSTRTEATRPNRTPLVSQRETALAVLLAVPGLATQWHLLTERYSDDLRRAEQDPLFHSFLGRTAQAWRQVSPQWAEAERLGAIWFPSGRVTAESKWALCKDLDAAWRRFHRTLDFTWDVIDQLTPWYDIVLDDEDAA